MEDEVKVVSSVNKEDWSRFVEENRYGNVFQTPEMAEVYGRTKRMEPISLFAVDESDNILSSVLAYVSTEKGGILKSVATRAVISGGPLFADNETGIKSLTELMQRYDEVAAKKAMFTEIRVLYDVPEFSALKNLGYTYEDHLNFLLDLNKSENELWAGLHDSRRRGIRKAQKNNLVIEEIESKKGLDVLYSILEETYAAAKVPLADSSLFYSCFNVLRPLGCFKAFLVKHDGEAVAVRILLAYKDRVYDWYNGSRRQAFSLCPNDLSEWHAIKWSKEKGYKIFDFCGAGKPDMEYGPRQFKKRFGGQLINFGRYAKVYHPIRLRIAKVGYEVHRRLFGGLHAVSLSFITKTCKKDTSTKKGTIILGGHLQALGIARSLGKHGVPVYLLNDKGICIARFSKYVKRFVKCPSLDNDKKFIDFLVTLAEKERLNGFILMPTDDAGVYLLSKNKNELEKYYRVSTPPWDITKFAYDKRLTYSLAEGIGVPTPKTFYPRNFEELDEIAEKIKFPVILKPAIMHKFYNKTKKKVVKVSTPKELKKAYTTVSKIIEPAEIMVQEVIPGNPDQLYSFCSFYKNQKLIGSCIGRRSRQRPMDFGHASTFVQSVDIPELRELGVRFLKEMNYYGLSEIEFKKDLVDGEFKLLEMNARTWLWHTLAIRCGIDFPYLLYRDMIGEKISPKNSFKENVDWIHFYTDFWVAMNEVLRGRLRLKDYLSSLKGEKEYAVFSLDDPLPFIMETILLPYLWITR